MEGMTDGKRDRLERIVSMAIEGGSDAGRNLSPDEAKMLGEFHRIVQALKRPLEDAPRTATEAAKALMSQDRPRHQVAKLVFSSLAATGARALPASEFQLVFEGQGHRVRLMYSPSSGGWDVAGKIEGPGWCFRRGKRRLPCPQGYFSFKARSLAQTGVVLEREDIALEIPSAEEARSGGADGDSR